MSDILLAKPQLPDDFIDTSVGEAYIIRECLSNLVEMSTGNLNIDPHTFEYQPPNGYKPLVKILEDKHNAPVVITCGAKQAIGAVFYALKKLGYDKYSMRTPYWVLIPPLADAHNMQTIIANPLDNENPYLMLAPNNPDNNCPSYDDLKSLHYQYKDKQIPFIHDAAYYTHTYLPKTYELGDLGDVQIFSMSKKFGLSGHRIGYAVCHDERFAPLIQNYVEMMTVGVSSVSQQLLYNLLSWEKDISEEFTTASYEKLRQNKQLIKNVNHDVLSIPDNFEDSYGMFGFFKVGPKADFKKAKVNVIDGNFFGKPGYVRMNLALPQSKLIEVVSRLNNI